MIQLVDAEGRSIKLGETVGRGGEGGVFDVPGDGTVVAKLYHKRPLPEDQVTKLQAMIALFSKPLWAISAWPRGMLFDPRTRQPCGILMPKVAGSRHLHELYGTTSRRQHFPDTAWHHMVLAARNTAAAFHAVQSTGVVIGDVNQGNLMVDDGMCVRLIDCDSFQIEANDRLFHCPVGTPHFTPPELQSLQLRDVSRTINHDGFGLAVLIFHLLFMGRHPFAGRYLGPGDMTIEKAIAERRFAFSRNKQETLVDPPPASLLLEDLPKSLGNLFERAFRSDGLNGQMRPTPAEWVAELEALIKKRKTCSYDPLHVYYAGLSECPWCRIEDFGGPSFFVGGAGSSTIDKGRLTELNNRVQALTLPVFPDLPPTRVALPSLPPIKKSRRRPPLTVADLLTGLVALGGAACVGAIWSPWALLAATVLAIGGGAGLLLDPFSKSRRKQVDEFRAWLDEANNKIWSRGQTVIQNHRQDAAAFHKSTEELATQLRDYNAEGKSLVRVLVSQSDSQRDELLRAYLIRDHMTEIPGMTPSVVVILQSYGIESAYDVERVCLYGIPMLSSQLLTEMLEWRENLERDFVFKPHHGVTPEELELATEAATQRYKVSQARRVLTAANRLEAESKTAGGKLDGELAGFDDLVKEWRTVGKQLRDFQSARRPLERRLNSSLLTIGLTMAAIPLVGALAWLLFG